MSDVSLLQDFSESVAADVLDVSKSDVSSAIVGGTGLVGFDPIAFLAFLEAIMSMISKLIENCPQPPTALRESIKRPNIRQRVAVRVAVSNECDCSGQPGLRRRSGRLAGSLIRLGGQQDDATIDAIVADCRSNILGDTE